MQGKTDGVGANENALRVTVTETPTQAKEAWVGHPKLYCKGCTRSCYANLDLASLSSAVVADESRPTTALESGHLKRCSREQCCSHDGCRLREFHQRVLHSRDAPRRSLSA